MGTAIIQPSRVRRLFNGWSHGVFAGQRFEKVLNLGSGHDHDRQGYMYSGYFDARMVIRLDKTTVTTYPPEEKCLNGSDVYPHPSDQIIGTAEKLTFADATFDMVFANWMLYQINWEKAVREIYRVLKSQGKLLATFMDAKQYGPLYQFIRERFDPISYCYLKMDKDLDGRDWVAEGIWGKVKK